MKTSIYFFSGTGNSLHIANALTKYLDSFELIPIKDTLDESLISKEKIGVIFPVYMWGIPLIVVDFLKKISNKNLKYIFSIINYGGSGGGTLAQVKNILSENKITLNSGFEIRMPSNYIVLSSSLPKEKQEKLFKDMEEKMENISKHIIHNTSNDLSISLQGRMASFIAYRFINKVKKMDKNFHTDKSCNQCGICEKICPVSNIKLHNGIPTWNNNCEQCLSCIQWCPQSSIQYGKSSAKKTRYQNPYVKLNDMLK